MSKIDFTSDPLANGIYEALLAAGIDRSEIDRGYHTIDYAQSGPNETHSGQADGVIDPREVYETALDLFDRHPEDPRYRRIVEGLAGAPIPWVLDDSNPLTVFDEGIRTRVREAVSALREALVKTDFDPGSAAYQERLATGLFYFTAFPAQKKSIRGQREDLRKMTAALVEAGWADFQQWLLQNGGLGAMLLTEEASVESPALAALQSGQGACTEQSNILYGVFKLAGLQPVFCHTPTREIQAVLVRNNIPVDPKYQEMGHVYVGIDFGEGLKFFDIQDVFIGPAEPSPEAYPNKYPLRLIHILAGLKGNRAHEAHRFGKVDEAVTLCREAIALEPTKDDYHWGLAILLEEQGALAEAEAAVRRAIALNPDRQVYLAQLNRILQRQGRDVDAASLIAAESANVPALALPSYRPRPRDWARLSPYAADLNRFLAEKEVDARVRDELVDAALLKNPTYLVPAERPSWAREPWSRLLAGVFAPPETDPSEPVQRLRLDPLQFDSVDPYDYIMGAREQEIHFLIQDNARLNLAGRNLIDALNTEMPATAAAKKYLHGLLDVNRLKVMAALAAAPAEDAPATGSAETFFDTLTAQVRSRSKVTPAYQAAVIGKVEAFMATTTPEVTCSTAPEHLQADIAALGAALRASWTGVYYDAYLLPAPGSPLSPDGDLSASLRWRPAAPFDTVEQQGLFEALVPAPDGGQPAPLPALRRLRFVIDTELPIFLRNQDARYSGSIRDQLSRVRFEWPKRVLKGDFSYSDILVPPTREQAMMRAGTRLDDLRLVEARLNERTGEVQFTNDPVWERLRDRLLTARDQLADGTSEHLIEAFRGDKWEKIRMQEIVPGFDDYATNILLGLHGRFPLSHLADFLADKIQMLEKGFATNSTPDAQRVLLRRQIAEVVDAIIEVLDTTVHLPNDPAPLIVFVARKHLHPAQAAAFAEYFDQYLWLLRNFRDSLWDLGVVPRNVFLANTRAAAARVSAVLARADQVLSLPADLSAALAAWPAFQDYMTAVNGADPGDVWFPALFAFVLHNTDAQTFFTATEQAEVPHWLVNQEMLGRVDALEAEVLGFVRPAQAEVLINRLRYALYVARHRVAAEETRAQRLATEVNITVEPKALAQTGESLRRFIEFGTAPAGDFRTILPPLAEILSRPDLFPNHREYFTERLKTTDPESADDVIAEMEAYLVTLPGNNESDLSPAERSTLIHANAELMRRAGLIDPVLLDLALNGTPNPLQVRIRDNLQRWRDALDSGWPHPDGSSPFFAAADAPAGEEAFRPDMDFLPTEDLHLSEEEFLGLLSDLRPDPDQEQEAITRLTFFLADYDDGYYRYFSPIAFERNTSGGEIKGVRDHTAYHRLLIVLDDIAAYAEHLVANEAGIDAERRAYYLSVARVTRAAAFNLEKFLSRQPQMPFWTLVQDGRVKGTVQQDLIHLPPELRYGPPGETARLADQRTVAQVQSAPWDLYEADGFFTQLTDGFGVTDWLSETQAHARFVPADFDGLSPDDWISLRERLLSPFPGLAEDTQRRLATLARAADEIVYDDTYDPEKNFVIAQKTILANVLSEMAVDPTLYDRNRKYFDGRIAALPAPERGRFTAAITTTAASREGDTELSPAEREALAQQNFLLLALMDPAFIPATYEKFYRIDEREPLIGIFEDALRTLPPSQPPEFIEWYLATADAPEICYLLGRLAEIGDVTRTPPERLKRYEEIREKILHVSLAELKTVPVILRRHSARATAFLLQDGTPSSTTDFLGSLAPSEVLWVGPYIRQKVAASERERKNRTDDVHYENVRQTDIDRYLAGLDRQAALALKRRVLNEYAPEFDEPALSDESAAGLANAVDSHFNNADIRRGREATLRAFQMLDRRHGSDPITPTEMLAAAAGLADTAAEKRFAAWESRMRQAADGPYNPGKVHRFLATARAAAVSDWQRRLLYQLVYNSAIGDYKVLARDFIRGSLTSPGLLDDESEDLLAADDSGEDLAEGLFWDWLWDCVWRGDAAVEGVDDPVKLIGTLDAAIAYDLGDDVTGEVSRLDLPSESVIRHTLNKIKNAAPATIQTLADALFEPFNLADPAERARHSRYNPNGYFQEGPKMDLARIFSPENLVRIHIHHDREVMVRLVYSKPYAIADALFGVRTLLELPENDADWEALARRSFDDEDVLAVLLLDAVVWGQLKRDTMALLSYRTHPYPSLRPGQAVERFAWIERRVSGRVREIPAERRLRELVALWAMGPSEKIRSVADVPWREAADLDETATARSAALCAELGALYGELAASVPTAAGEAHAAYLRERCEEIRLAVLLATQLAVDPADPAMPSTYEELAQQLWSELTDLAGTAPPLQFFGEALREEIFEPPAGVMTQPFIHISGDDVGEDFAGKLKNIYWMSTRYLTLALATLAGMQRRVETLRSAGVLLTEHQIRELEGLQHLLALRRRFLELQLKKEQELAHL